MSSIVKKSSHFTPKVKKRPVRKSTLATPPATQTAPEDPHCAVEDNNNDAILEKNPKAESPPASQTSFTQKTQEDLDVDIENDESPQLPLLNYSISAQPPTKPLKCHQDESVVDSMLKVDELAVLRGDKESENEGEYGDNDIFKQPMAMDHHARRRSSVASHHRLSGITPSRRNNALSIPGIPAAGNTGNAVTAGTGGHDLQTKEAPVPIGVPRAKTTKKRRISSVSRASKRPLKGSVIAIPLVPHSVLDEEQETENVDDTKTITISERDTTMTPGIRQSPSKKQAPSADFVVGVDLKTNRVIKYRTSDQVEGQKVPLVPAELITSISSVRQLPRRVKPEDEKLFSQVTVLAENMSMADLCKPLLQIGLTSETFALAEAAKVKIRERKETRKKGRALARALRISYKKALRQVQGDTAEDEAGNESGEDGAKGPPKAVDFSKLVPAQVTSSSIQLAVVEGQLQVDQESVIRNRGIGANRDNRPVELENLFENPITAGTYSKVAHTDAWTTDEMVELYKALSTWGTDFTVIAQLFPYRTRHQVKNKFTLEEKQNPQLVELALRRKLPQNYEEFCARAASVTALKSVDAFNKEMADIRKEHESHLKEITAERERAMKEDLEANRKREIEIRTGSKPMTKAERSRMIRANEVVVGEIEDVKRTRESLDAGGH